MQPDQLQAVDLDFTHLDLFYYRWKYAYLLHQRVL